MGWRDAWAMFRAAEAVPPGAARPTMTMWYDPGGVLPPVSWAPVSGEFETHWDWGYWSAVAIPAVWRARMLISQSIGAMPVGAWRDMLAVEPLPSVLRTPNPHEDRANTIAAWVCDLLDHGNAIGIINWEYTTDTQGRPTVNWPLVSVTPVRASETEVTTAPDGAPYYKIGDRGYTADQIFHAKGTCLPGDVRGIGVLEAGLSTLDRVRSESAYAAKAFASGIPSGLLRVKDPDLQPGTDDDEPGYVTAKGIKKAWQASVATGDVAVLSDLVDFTPLSWTPTDAQMVEARQLSLTDISGLFNIDGYWLGAPAAPMVYQNVQQAALQLSRFTLGFWITSLEAQLSRLLPRGQQARFARDTILRDDQTTRVANYEKLLSMGVLTVDEVRTLEGLPPMDEGTELSPVTPMFPDGDAGTNEAVS